MKILKTLDYVFNKVIPKKYTIAIAIIIMTCIFKDKIPSGFYNAMMAYFGGSAVVSGITTAVNKARKYE